MAVKAKTIEKEKKEWNASGAFDCLAVTSVQVYPFREGPSMGHIKGLASIVLNDQFLIRGLRVMEGENGMFVGYPVDPFFKGDEYRSVCNPITKAFVCSVSKRSRLASR